ncbi:ring canal kelch homolog [Folsomia candida]|uniref:ring canal kelch homolog n=1 Tax=Folsomia candida TaxID=158441 RepID=UPI000B9048C8|nr:ring canal kelch homolog [Folsomia candida]
MDAAVEAPEHAEAESPSNRLVGLLLRHASQNSLDESSQRNQSNLPEEDDYRHLYENQSHFGKAFGMLDTLRKNSSLCDVTLIAEELEIPAHRMILAACSPYFYAMFTSFEEKDKEKVKILGVEPTSLQILVTYVYTGQISISEDNVQTLLPAANLLQLHDVKEACSDFLKSQIHPSNCLGIRAFADLHGCLDLLTATETFIEFNFADVVEGEEFLSLNVQEVIALISSDKLTTSEETVFESVLNWINYDHEGRREHVPTLMENVRLPLLSQDYLLHRVDEEPLLRLNPTCKDLLIEALKFHLLRGEQKATFSSPRTKPRQPIGLPKVLLVVGGQAPKAIRCVESYDFKDERWRLLPDMPSRRCRAGLAVVHNKVYAVGGFNGSLRVKTVDIFDPQTGKWTTGPPMNARRSTLGVAVLNHKIYAIAGFDGTTGLNTAELFDPVRGDWQTISSLSTRRSSVGVGVLNGMVYAVGGYDGASRQCLSSVERYDAELDSWTTVAEMSARRSGAGVGVLENVLYAVGGHDGPIVRKSAEKFDLVSNKWTSVAEMSTCRRNAGVVALGGYLYVVGGDDGTCNLSSVEVYDPKTDSWKLLSSSLVMGRSYAGVIVIDKPSGYQQFS